jgi:antitoxin component YwqK of YwqJK toxin-antitoxin module
MKYNSLLIIILLYSTVTFSQKDTLAYNDLKISVINKNNYILYKDKKYNGYLKIKMTDDNYCYEYVKEGLIVTNKCNLTKNKVVEKYKLEYSDYSMDKSVSKMELKSLVTKVQSDPCKDCDTIAYYVNRMYFKDKPYSGFAKSNDSVFFYFQGDLRFIKTLFPNSKVNEYIEFDKEKKNGVYKKYDKNGKVVVEGEYKSDKKTNKWMVYNEDGYDKILQDYTNDLKKGVWFYYKGKKVVRCEFYENNVLDYYYVSEFNKNKEIRSFFKNEKKYAISKYTDGHLDEYIKID